MNKIAFKNNFLKYFLSCRIHSRIRSYQFKIGSCSTSFYNEFWNYYPCLHTCILRPRGMLTNIAEQIFSPQSWSESGKIARKQKLHYPPISAGIESPLPPLTSSILYPRVEWFSIDCDFRNWTHCWSGTLYEFNLKNRQTKFCFFNHRYLKNNFFLNLQIPSYLLHRTIDIKKIRNRDIELLVRPQNGQNWFLNSFFQEIIFIFSF